MAKKIRYLRHSDKNHHNISQTGLDRGHEVDVCNVTDLFFGHLARTSQTLLAVVCSCGLKARVHEAVEEIGNDQKFNELSTPAFEKALEAGHDNLTSLKMAFSPAEFATLQAWAMVGLRKMFDQMPDNGYGLACGHDPIISLCAMACGAEGRSLKTLEYYDFEQDANGVITCE